MLSMRRGALPIRQYAAVWCSADVATSLLPQVRLLLMLLRDATPSSKLRSHAAAALGALRSRAALSRCFRDAIAVLSGALDSLDAAGNGGGAGGDGGAGESGAEFRSRPALRAALTCALLRLLAMGCEPGEPSQTRRTQPNPENPIVNPANPVVNPANLASPANSLPFAPRVCLNAHQQLLACIAARAPQDGGRRRRAARHLAGSRAVAGRRWGRRRCRRYCV